MRLGQHNHGANSTKEDVPLFYGDLLRAPQFYRIGGQGLWFPVFALTAFGLLFVYSSSSIYAGETFGSEFFFVKKQALAVLAGLGAALAGLLLNLDTLIRWSKWFFGAACLAIICTRVPGIGHEVNGAWRWIKLGPLSFQPAEITKLAFVLFTARTLTRAEQRPVQVLLPLAVVFPLLLQPDFGSSAVIFFAFILMLFVHGLPIRSFVLIALAALPLVGALVVLAPYRFQRLITFLDPFADPLGAGFQIIQSFLAIASGGLFGKGLGNSTQKLFFLPEAHTDFVVAVIGEEMGFAGILVLLAMLGLLFFSLLQILLSLRCRAHLLVCTGLFGLLVGNTLVNLGMVVGLLPTKGLPLPFVSAGGTAYMLSMFALGLFGQAYHRSLGAREADRKWARGPRA